MPDDDWSHLLGDDEPASKPRGRRGSKLPTIAEVVAAGGKLRQRSTRVGRLDDIHDVEHEAKRLYRAIRQNDGEDLILLHTAGDAIRSLKLLADIMGLGQLAMQMAEIKSLLADRAPASGRKAVRP